MPPKDLERLAVFNFPIEQFADRGARWLLENTEIVRGLLEIVSSELAARLDFSQLTHINRSFISDNLREQESDVVCSVPFRSDSETADLWIYILIEHQSTVDVSMGFRVLFYMMQIWDAQRREWVSNEVPKREWRFRPILPIVFYTGERRWDIPVTLNTVMEVPSELARFVPTFDTLLLDVKAASVSDLTESNHPFGWLLTVLQQETASHQAIQEALIEASSHIINAEGTGAGLREQLIFYLFLLILHRRPREEGDMLTSLISERIPDISQREEAQAMAQTMAEYLIQQGEARGEARGKKIGEARGEARGITRAKREALQKLLAVRFDPIPESVVQRISSLRSLARLDALFEQALTAETLNDIDWE